MPRSPPIHFLLVEDNPADADLTRELLADIPAISFDVATRLDEAIRRVRQADHHAVLLDLNLPDSDGVATFARFATACPGVPVIVLTGTVGDDTGRDAIRLGAVDYLPKRGLTGDIIARTLHFARERARQREELLQHKLYLDAVKQSVVVADLKGVIRYWNDGATALYGWTGGEAIGRDIRELRLSETTDTQRQANLESVQEGKTGEHETMGIRKDGTRFPMHYTITPTRDANGAISGIIGVSYDLTAQKRLEGDLRRTAEKALAAQRIAGVSAWHLDVATGQMTWDEDDPIGVSPAVVTGQLESGFEMLVEEDKPKVTAWLQTLRSSPTTLDEEHRLRAADGSIRIVHTIAKPVLDGEGKAKSVIGVSHDITQQREREAELARVRRLREQNDRLAALGTLVAGVAHEINNPLAYIQGNIDLVRMTLEEIAASHGAFQGSLEAIEQLDAALRGVQQITEITRSLKRVARQGDGEVKAFDLTKTVESILLVGHSRFPSGLTLNVDLSQEAIVTGDEKAIGQAVLNLVLNAAEALESTPQPRLTLVITKSRENVQLLVQDNGPGMPADVLKQLFTPFFTTKPEGTGLGLSISHGIAVAHGGNLEAMSDPGSGATFRLTLPCSPTPPHPGSTPQRAAVHNEDRPWQALLPESARHRHLAHVYTSTDEMEAEVVRWVHPSLRRGGGAILLATSGNAQRIRERLASLDDVAKRAEDAGRFVFIDADELLSRGILGHDPDEVAFRQAIEQAILAVKARVADPSAGVVAWGELVNVLWEQGRRREVESVERCWGRIVNDHGIDLLCSYHGGGLSAKARGDVERGARRTHDPSPDFASPERRDAVGTAAPLATRSSGPTRPP